MTEFWRRFQGPGRNSSGSPADGPDEQLKAVNVTRRTPIADRVEVADSSAKRSKGLLGRKGLAPGEGLWIVPCEAVHTFWMSFAIDLVYLDRQNRIAKIRTNVPPWRLSGCITAHSVLELAAGSVVAEKAQRGDQIAFVPVSSHMAGPESGEK